MPIGRERVDRTFFADLDQANLQLFMGAADPRNSRIMWAYKSANGASNQFDKILAYDFVLDKFTPIKISGEYLLQTAQPGLTLEGLNAVAPGGSIEAMVQSLDNFSTANTPELGAFDPAHRLNFFRGGNLEAVLETAEQGTDGRRLKLRGFRPVTDAPILYGAASRRETQAAAALAGAESLINPVTGRCNMVVDTRYTRYRCRIPTGTAWTFIAGVEPDVIATGRR